MLESAVTISITGLIAGFVFAMPIAGPISILIVSNALNGKFLYSKNISFGAALSDFIYIFIAVYGITKLYTWYKPAIPYLFLGGAVFFIILGIKIFKTPFNPDNFEETSQVASRFNNEEKGGFYTGFMVNLLNPTLFISGLISSFFVISLVSSLGFNTGGLEMRMNDQVNEISSIEGTDLKQKINVEKLNKFAEEYNQGYNSSEKKTKEEQEATPRNHLIMSFCYAFFLAAGGFTWFYILAYMLSKYRKRVNMKVLTLLIRVFGISLGLLGTYFGYMGASHFFHH
jgi:threonine/homoserine/homoserine lactone efflux protein